MNLNLWYRCCTSKKYPNWLFLGLLLVSLLVLPGCFSDAEKSDPKPPIPNLQLTQAFTNLSFAQPIFMLQAPGDSSQWYLLERRGNIYVFNNDPNVASSSTFLDLTSAVDSSGGEMGLLGMAFHPNFPTTNEIFLSYTANIGGTVSRITRYDLGGSTETTLIELVQPADNHNGGHIAFGPDGFLYIGLGDGGATPANSQNTSNLFGAMLRIDVDSDSPYAIPPGNPFSSGGGSPEIYAWGLRNPWRWSFDRANGNLWLGDVGQNTWEEIDLVGIGQNFGWNMYEGNSCSSGPCNSLGMTMPIVEYEHISDNCSVTGGYVYRGNALPGLVGVYLYGDYCTGNVWGLDTSLLASPVSFLAINGTFSLSSFAEGVDGELYVLNYGAGTIHLIEAAP